MSENLRGMSLIRLMGLLCQQGWNIMEVTQFQYIVTTPLPIDENGRDMIRGLFRVADSVDFVESEIDG
jgi:hypothetical protein